ncbi:MAG: phenylalanine--tRNA ligase subunit beta [Pseudomonadota bacterium]
MTFAFYGNFDGSIAMRISEKWLREWVDPSLTSQELAESLTMAGLEIEKLEPADDDHILEIGLTPNRGDCASVMGMARELAAITGSPLHDLPPIDALQSIDERLTADLLATEKCARYVGCVIRGVDNTRTTPRWLQQRLEKSGIASLTPIVDITNYVMLELGQPLHAFDLSCLHGGIQVRSAKPDETLELLDNTVVNLSEDDLVIADHEKALALAGIMGGLNSAVSENTQDAFLESAFFEPVNIALTSRRHTVSTDSSYRFERGVDPMLQKSAIKRAIQLIVEICGGEVGPVNETLDEKQLPSAAVIKLRPRRLNKVIGTTIEPELLHTIFTRLNLTVDKQGDEHWLVQCPSYRFDLKIEEDLIEEAARLYGYNHIPAQQLSASDHLPLVDQHKVDHYAILSFFKALGYQEVITYSFVAEKIQTILNPQHQAIALSNPVSNEMAVMRTNLWSGLINAALHNLNRQVSRLRLFELGSCFHIGDERQYIGGLVTGPVYPEQWGSDRRSVDFFDVKGDIQQLLAITHRSVEFTFEKSDHPALHPQRCALIRCHNRTVGILGAIHPYAAAQLELPTETYLFELQLNEITTANKPVFEPISRFPSIRRDLSLLVDQHLTVDELISTIKATAGDLLEDVVIFDLYQGKGVQAGKKSIALGLILQDFSRTLTDEDVEKILTAVIAALKRQYQAELRI